MVKLIPFRIRPALPRDADSCAEIHIRSWRDTYHGIVPQKHLDSLNLESRRLLWTETLTVRKPKRRIWVAECATEEQKRVAGFLVTESSRNDAFPEWGEFAAFYLLKEFHGLGMGAALFRAGGRGLLSDGLNQMFLWVLKENPTSEFYRRMGGKDSGIKRKIEIGGSDLEEIAYVWPVLGASRIFHIVEKTAWERARTFGRYEASSLEKEGFIHFSEKHQVARTANLFFRDRQDLVVLEVDPTLCKAMVKYEGDPEAFPHLYGPLEISAVISVRDFRPGPTGEFE